MKLSLHGSIALSALVLASAGFVITRPDVSRELGIDVWLYDGDADELHLQQERLSKLCQKNERVTRRLSLKSIIVRNLIEGRITIAEAADQFVALNQMDGELSKMTRSLYPAATEKESAAMQVIRFAMADLGAESKDKEVMDRLNSQLQQLKHLKPSAQ